MKKSELHQLIKEEIIKVLYESFYKADDMIKTAETETGKKIKIPNSVKQASKDIKKYGFISKIDSDVLLLLYYNFLNGQKTNDVVMKYIIDRYGSGYFYSSYSPLIINAQYIAVQVIKGIQDKINNKEHHEGAYGETKEYFKNFGLDYSHNRTFDWAVKNVEEWLNKKGIK